jgi:hypothetical protein
LKRKALSDITNQDSEDTTRRSDIEETVVKRARYDKIDSCAQSTKRHYASKPAE